MGDAVIRVAGLGKMYRIGAARSGADGLRHALEALLAAWPDFRAARPLAELPRIGSMYIRALEHLPGRAA